MKIIDVIVMIFPDGSIIYSDNTESTYNTKLINNWKKKFGKRFENTDCSMAIAHIKMFESDYKQIPINNVVYDLMKD